MTRLDFWTWCSERMLDASRWFSDRATVLEDRAREIELRVEGDALFEEISASIDTNQNWRNGNDVLLYLKENDRVVYCIGLRSFTISRDFRSSSILYGTNKKQQEQIIEWASRAQKDDTR